MDPMRQRPRGYTIVEVMVMAVVVVVVMGLLFNIFLVALQRTQDGRTRVDLQQEALFALVAWEKDLARTGQYAIGLQIGDPLYIGITRAFRVTGNGTPAWEDDDNTGLPVLARWKYDATARTLSRGMYDRGPNSTAVRPTPPGLDSLVAIPGQGERVYCKDVEEFSLKDRDDRTSLSFQPLVLRLKLRRALSTSQRFAEFTIERRYTLRNSF